ncbi:hypothetical protein GCM10027347_02180 [Larkinella harenae]
MQTIDTDSTVLLDALFLKAIRAHVQPQTVFHEHLYHQESGFASSPIVIIPNTRPSSFIRLEYHPDGYLAMVHAGVNALAVFQALNRA